MRNMELLFVKDMFNTIAPWYDFLNRFLSLGQDIYWRREMVTALKISNSSKTIDIACGTCDVAIEIIKQKGKNAKVIGVDFSPGMLAPGLKKIINGKLESNIFLAAGNALSLPVTKKSFDGVSIAFGIRNIKDRTKALQEFYASLKTGGKIAVLELSTPSSGFFRSIYLFYFKKLLPLVGGFFSRNNFAYSYLPDSVLNFPAPEIFAELMQKAGFKNIRWKNMTLGIVTLYIGEKY